MFAGFSRRGVDSRIFFPPPRGNFLILLHLFVTFIALYHKVP